VREELVLLLPDGLVPGAQYRSVLRYFRPESTMRVTTVAAGPSFFATSIAAQTFPPDDVPAKIPALPANRLAMSLASAVELSVAMTRSLSVHRAARRRPKGVVISTCRPAGRPAYGSAGLEVMSIQRA
jgi:hypothetical protein